jgi:hypothetical protein
VLSVDLEMVAGLMFERQREGDWSQSVAKALATKLGAGRATKASMGAS